MASEQAILNIMGRALWDPNPTVGSDLRARQLAAALGYPKTWRVVRTIEDAPAPPHAAQHDDKGKDKETSGEQENVVARTDANMETNEATKTDEKAVADTNTATTSTANNNNDKDAPPLEATTESKDEKVQTEVAPKEDAIMEDPKISISSNNDVDGKNGDDKMEIDEQTAAITTIAEKVNESVIHDKAETAQEAAKIDATGIDTSNNNEKKNNHANAEQTAKETKASDDDDKKVPASATSTSNEPTTMPAETNNEKVPATTTSSTPAEEQPQPTTTPKKTIAKKVIVDRIYAGKPGTDCDMWFNHYAAMQAAQQWDALIISSNNSESAAASSSTSPTTKLQQQEMPTPFHFKGGHLLPRVSKFEKNDKVEVYFENTWWDAKILRKKEHVIDGFRYQVQYNVDNSKQSGVDENLIRHRTITAKDPHDVATLLGFDAGWQAVSTGHNRWKITSPSGVTYQSKRAALKAAKDEGTKAAMEVGDPPWRTTGHDYIGRLVLYTQEHAISARRKIKVQQTGKVVGWISATDVDQAGQPGFVSESTGKPANLFHVEFDDTPQHHPYPSYLVQSQDLEEFEVEACLISIPEGQEDNVVVSASAKKRARTKR